MKVFVALFALLVIGRCEAGDIQPIKLVKIYRWTIRPDYTRYEYVFSTTNHKPHRLNLAADVSLLNPDKNEVGTGFIYFETPPGKTATNSIEADAPPISSGDSAREASEYRLEVRDHAMTKRYDEEGSVAGVPVVHKQG